MRRRNLAALLIGAALLAACSDAPTTASRRAMKAPTLVGKDIGDWVTWGIWNMYPSDIAATGNSLWDKIRSEYLGGDFASAQSDFFTLAGLIQSWIPLVTPLYPEDTKLGDSANLVNMMASYMFQGGPNAVFHHLGPDATFALIIPGHEQTVVTPSLHAGVFFNVHSTTHTFLLIVDGATTKYPANCSGPLQTARCQYPQFYRFHPYPYVSLAAPTSFGVCHVNTGSNRMPLPGSDHDNYRLAHEKPANPADYVPGGTIPTEPGENVEILPLVSISFLNCQTGDDFYLLSSASPSGYMDHLAQAGQQRLRQFAGAAERLLLPAKAYAIDQGGGGLSLSFSDFNVLDPLSAPDLSVGADPAAPTPTADPGQALALGATVANVGTATATSDTIEVSLQATGSATVPPPIVFTSVVSTMVPLDPALPVTITLPSTIPTGTYTATIRAATANTIPESNLANNSVSIPVVIGTVIP